MLFSSTVFLCFFLPCVLAGYYAFKWNRTLQNLFLFAASILFYAWGEPKFVFVMLLSIVVNWLFGLLVSGREHDRRTRAVLGLAVTFNIAVLFVFKYLDFSISAVNAALDTSIPLRGIVLPIGISFFTFQAMSYVIDVYRGNGRVQKNVLNVGLYISFFPQLIAGPIVRYETVAEEMKNRRETWDDFFGGFARFVEGFCKKVLLANTLAPAADYAFDTVKAGGSVSVLTCWLGAVCYALQIYFDFGGYSDMAIGLGRMFGFHFLENFNYPYISASITEFWRRWHISLGSWFRDYVYIPLGGSRVTKRRLVCNLLVVWALTGIWHGANWTFFVWGLLYFALLTAEKLTDYPKKPKTVWSHVYTLFFVLIGWVIFRADSMTAAMRYLANMAGIGAGSWMDGAFIRYLKPNAVFLAAGLLLSTPVVPALRRRFEGKLLWELGYGLALTGLFVIGFAGLVSSAYNPFIYFQF